MATPAATRGSTTIFSLPFGYITGSLTVFLTGLLLRPGIDFTESDNVAGEFTMTSPPAGVDWLAATALTLDA